MQKDTSNATWASKIIIIINPNKPSPKAKSKQMLSMLNLWCQRVFSAESTLILKLACCMSLRGLFIS